MFFDDNSLSIGRTPLVKLNRVVDGAKGTVLAKIEGRNPAYSVKCRIGASMIWDAEKRSVLKPGKELVELKREPLKPGPHKIQAPQSGLLIVPRWRAKPS